MAITLTLSAQETFVKSGQPTTFMLTVANGDGATRVVEQITFRGEQLQIAASLDVPMLTDDNSTILDTESESYMLRGVFFASAVPGATAESVTMDVMCEVTMTDTSGTITSVGQSSAVSMSVVPVQPNDRQPLANVFPSLNFQSNNNAIYMTLPLV